MINNLSNSFDGFLGLGIGFFIVAIILFFVLMVAIVALKGYALWTAARRDEKGWFVALLIVNTMGILELAYLYFVADIWKKKKVETSTPSVPESKP